MHRVFYLWVLALGVSAVHGLAFHQDIYNSPVVRAEVSSTNLPDTSSTSKTILSASTIAPDYFRVAVTSIVIYDFAITLPAEWRLYSGQRSFFQMSRACILFIGVRYTSVIGLAFSNAGAFGKGFSPDVCQRYQLVAPLMKLFAVIFSQLITAIRTYAISRKNSRVAVTLSFLFIACLVPEFISNTWQRIPIQNDNNNCLSGERPGSHIAWIHFLAAIIFDTATTAISTRYLLYYSPNRISLMSGLSRLMLKEGMIYFVVLAVVNIFNLVVFYSAEFSGQAASATLSTAFTMIMSQRIILGLQAWLNGCQAFEAETNAGQGATEYDGGVVGTGGRKSHAANVQMLTSRAGLASLKIQIPTTPPPAALSSPLASPTSPTTVITPAWSPIRAPVFQRRSSLRQSSQPQPSEDNTRPSLTGFATFFRAPPEDSESGIEIHVMEEVEVMEDSVDEGSSDYTLDNNRRGRSNSSLTWSSPPH